ncbi:MAG TPA: hypothetical protein VHJ79_05625, partial [Mycobacterium sp.]|nr:hypothetical protein [Mycobacterium sp.]
YIAEHVSPMHDALAVGLGLNRLRVSEACAANVMTSAPNAGIRTLRIVGKANRPATVPLLPRPPDLDLAIGERTNRPIRLPAALLASRPTRTDR